eukprot:Tamp_25655.p1 GENE.Tamp_25655~~Tamp_25655.p1  ORF type:complete len:283 (+),score=57.42 Tamp_25655:115-849(+)
MATDFLDAFSFPLEKLSLTELERRTPPPPPSQTAPASTGQDAEMPPVDALDELEDSRVLHDVLHAPRDAAPELSPEPLNSSHLSKCYYLHGLFEESFMDLLGALAEELPGDTASNNMAATRRFFESERLGEALLARLPKALGYSRVMPAMRFIEYDIGGYIRPHKDGIMFDKVTSRQTTTSFLLYMRDTPTGGTTDFLDDVTDGNVLYSVAPRRGSILVFPHDTPHEGAGVGGDRKVLLRGDLF